MVKKAPLAILALAGPAVAGVIERGEWKDGDSDWKGKIPHLSHPHSHHEEKPKPSEHHVTKPSWYTKTTTYLTTSCPGMLWISHFSAIRSIWKLILHRSHPL